MSKSVKPLGPQFVRIEHYAIGPSNHSKSRKGGNDVSFIVREFLRAPTASLHVSHPQPPVLLLGNVDHVRTLPARLREGAKSVRSATGRRQRIDCPVLMPIIFSYPGNTLSKEYLDWERDTLDFVQRHFGRKVEAVARHSDESRLHLHALIHDEGRPVKRLSPGYTAEGKRSIKELKKFQNLYYEEVSKKNHLTRLGPKRRRILSTKEHKESVRIAETLQKDIQHNQTVLKRHQAEIQLALSEEAVLTRRKALVKSRIAAETTELQLLVSAKEAFTKRLTEREAAVLAKELQIGEFLRGLDDSEMEKLKGATSSAFLKRLTGNGLR